MASVDSVVTPTTVRVVSRSRCLCLGKTLETARAAEAPQMAVAQPMSKPRLRSIFKTLASSKARPMVAPTATNKAITVCQPRVTTCSTVRRRPSKATPMRSMVLEAN